MTTDPVSTTTIQDALAHAFQNRQPRPIAREPKTEAVQPTTRAPEPRAYTPRGAHFDITA